jgi:hypothetical protein
MALLSGETELRRAFAPTKPTTDNMSAPCDDEVEDTPGVNTVAVPFTDILYEDDTEEQMADVEPTVAQPVPMFADAHLMPDFKLQHTALSSFKNNPDYLMHLRDNRDGLIAGTVLLRILIVRAVTLSVFCTAAASSCRAVKIYDRSLSFLSALEGHSEVITDICFVPTVSSALLSCSEDGNLMCFDAKNNKVVSKLKGIGGKSLYCCASNGQLMVAGGEAGICFWYYFTRVCHSPPLLY